MAARFWTFIISPIGLTWDEIVWSKWLPETCLSNIGRAVFASQEACGGISNISTPLCFLFHREKIEILKLLRANKPTKKFATKTFFQRLAMNGKAVISHSSDRSDKPKRAGAGGKTRSSHATENMRAALSSSARPWEWLSGLISAVKWRVA